MNDDQLLRYSRHILLDEIGIEGQQRLLAAHVLVIGAGGLGSPVALYLGSAGVGRITLVDDDAVDLTNLQRQIAHSMARVGRPKVESARDAIGAINPEVRVDTVMARADAAPAGPVGGRGRSGARLLRQLRQPSRVNAACVRHGIPLVSGAAIRFDGQVTVFDPRQAASPCYACLFPPDSPVEEANCATMGVFAPLVGMVGSVQAAEALKLLSQSGGRSLVGRLLIVDGRSMEWTELGIRRLPECQVCGAGGHH